MPHLTYVGDADIGEHSNIGASSVFVNYDGENKSRTTIGSHVRTGSDTMFVAPVTVGDGAYTGAGTVVRDDVPPGALAVSAGPQRNIEGWVERKRPGSGGRRSGGAHQASARRPPRPGEQRTRTTPSVVQSGNPATHGPQGYVRLSRYRSPTGEGALWAPSGPTTARI